MVWFWMIIAMVMLAGCAVGGSDVVDGTHETLGGCVLSTAQDPLRGQAELHTYRGRRFLAEGNHLGWDIMLPQGAAVFPIGCGVVRAARAAQGYGTLVVVIEHRLSHRMTFINGLGRPVTTDSLLSIYGHVRPTRDANGRGPRASLSVGMTVDEHTVLGYIEEDALNGDGAEHLHLGMRLQSAAEAQRTDPSAWFRGYNGTPSQLGWFADPEEALLTLQASFLTPPDAPTMPAPTLMDAGTARPQMDAGQPLPPPPPPPRMDAGFPTVPPMDAGTMPPPPVDAGQVVVPPPPPPPPDVPPVQIPPMPEVPDVYRYAFRIRSGVRVMAPYRLRNLWWQTVLCQNTNTTTPAVTSDGWAVCDTGQLALFDGSSFAPDHLDWGDQGQIATVGNSPERCTYTPGAEWRITRLRDGRVLYSGPVTGLRCMAVGSQDRLVFPSF